MKQILISNAAYLAIALDILMIVDISDSLEEYIERENENEKHRIDEKTEHCVFHLHETNYLILELV